MRIALLTNSRLSIPSIDFLGTGKQLVAVALPARDDRTEDADHIQYTASRHQVPLTVFAKNGFAAALAEWLDNCKPDVVFVFTFPFKIPAEVLSIPPKGFINFHFGLLPQYRGADAIFWQIRNREKEGGISVHQVTAEIDKGALYLIHKLPIHPADTYGSHLLNLSMAAVQVVQQLIPVLQMTVPGIAPQDETLARYYRRPALADVQINWSSAAAEIVALVNATNPWNKGAVAYLNGYPLKILAVTQVNAATVAGVNRKPGTIIVFPQGNGCSVCCGLGEIVTLDILYCNDSFMTGIQFARMGIMTGMQFEMINETSVV